MWCVVLMAASLLGIWAQLVTKLTTDWSANQQYEFGIFIPFFVAVLIARRWSDRPAGADDVPRGLLLALAGALILSLLPLRIIQEANPDWRPLNWVHTSVVVALTLIAAAALGGKGWARHFGVPALLIFFASPWPLATEQGVIQFLSRLVTAGTTEILNWVGIPAIQRGNVIEVASGLVGVNEACSGIRSLAATLMAAAFFGEFYRLTWPRRGVLVVLGVAVAFALNVGRAFILGYLQARHGAEALESWHDTTGLSIFVVSFAILWWIASALISDDDDLAPEQPGDWKALLPQAAARIPTWLPALIVVWLAAVEISREYWYRVREKNLAMSADWSVAWPKDSRNFRAGEVSEEVRSILRYSEAANGVIAQPGELPWSIYFLRWKPGRTSAQLAVMHRPEICLPAAGSRYVGDGGLMTLDVHGLSMPFSGAVFSSDAGSFYVYRCLWEDRMLTGAMRDRNFDMSIRGRVLSAWHGRRNLGQRLLQIAILGAPSEAAAREDLQRRLPDLISVAR